MSVTWDPEKARQNHRKHGIRFPDAEGVLYDPNARTREDLRAVDERRFVSVGFDFLGRVVTLVYSHQKDAIRLISARRATAKERNAYEEGIRLP